MCTVVHYQNICYIVFVTTSRCPYDLTDADIQNAVMQWWCYALTLVLQQIKQELLFAPKLLGPTRTAMLMALKVHVWLLRISMATAMHLHVQTRETSVTLIAL